MLERDPSEIGDEVGLVVFGEESLSDPNASQHSYMSSEDRNRPLRPRRQGRLVSHRLDVFEMEINRTSLLGNKVGSNHEVLEPKVILMLCIST